MRSKSVLAHSGMLASLEQIVLEPTLDHPPSKDALKSDQAADSHKSLCHVGTDSSPSDEVGCWQEEGNANYSAPQSMSPLHPIDMFELFQIHPAVQHLELRAESVEGELRLPVLLVEGWKGTGYGPPFCDTESGFRESCQATKHYDPEDTCG